MADGATGKLDIGKVISGTFRVVGADPFNFFALTLGLIVVPSVIQAFVRLSSGVAPTAFPTNPLFWITTALSLLASFLAYGALTWLSGEVIAKRRVHALDALRAGLSRLPLLLGLLTLQLLALMVGFALLVVPGVMMALAWSVTLPVLMLERSRVFAAFGRSARLTKGNRWRILGLLAIYVIASVLILAIFGLLAYGAIFLGPALGVGLASVVVGPLLNLFTYPLTNAGLTVLYAELRDLNDGGGPEGLAKVFD